ncbi:hypothetical protein L1987_48581 [Smallanthus sonchifolius]|uniref:Uncharacterized protein n=1 Tax=Smallanthus sonchifolius TaxID=185202 RepID=A0ACB9FRQ4_9ASTR|nr:hypothetical protein L1987_48581 [Smallanthus sonchifolius]
MYAKMKVRDVEKGRIRKERDEVVKIVRKKKKFEEDVNVSSSGYEAQSVVLKSKFEELDVTKRLALPVADLITLLNLKMISTLPKGYDLENYLRRQTRDNFKSLKKPSITKRNLSRFAYSCYPSSSRQRTEADAPIVVLPQYIELFQRNTISLQPFTWMYFDSKSKDLVIERGDQEPIKVYDVNDKD